MASIDKEREHLIELANEVLERIKIKKMSKEVFNVFSVLKVERKEVELHSQLLYELLNPKGTHKLNNVFIKIFLEEIIGNKEYDYLSIKVKRELYAKENGRMDLVIEDRENLTIIEMKIDAKDQVDQLLRYDKYAKKVGKKDQIFYLTLFGNEASEISTSESQEYKCISFKKDIRKFITLCIEKSVLLPKLRETLIQYREILDKICFNLNEEEEVEIKEFLLKGNNLKIVEELSSLIPQVKADIESTFWDELSEKLEKKVSNLNFELAYYPEVNYILECRKFKTRATGLEYLYDREKFENYYLMVNILYLRGDSDIYIEVCLENENGEKFSLENIEIELLKVLKGFKVQKGESYIWKYIGEGFYYDNESFYKLKDKGKREKIIKKIIEEFEEVASNEELKKVLRDKVRI